MASFLQVEPSDKSTCYINIEEVESVRTKPHQNSTIVIVGLKSGRSVELYDGEADKVLAVVKQRLIDSKPKRV